MSASESVPRGDSNLTTSLQVTIQRAILAALPRRHRGPQVTFKKVGSWELRGRDPMAVHIMQPNEYEFHDALDLAQRDGFLSVCVYI